MLIHPGNSWPLFCKIAPTTPHATKASPIPTAAPVSLNPVLSPVLFVSGDDGLRLDCDDWERFTGVPQWPQN